MLSRVSHGPLCETPWTVSLQTPLSMGILQTRILEWVAMPSSSDLPDPGMEPMSLNLLHWQVGCLPLAPPGNPLPQGKTS